MSLNGCVTTQNDSPGDAGQHSLPGQVVLRAVTGLQPNNIQVESFLANFRDRLNEEGKGLVRVDYLGSHDVIPPRKVGSALKSGHFDILHSPVSYYIGMVPEGYGMMGANQPPEVLRRNGGWKILQDVFAKKAGSRLIAWGESATRFQIYLSKKPGLNRDGVPDLSGFKMRVTGTYRPLFELLGATTVNVRSRDIKEYMSRKLIDGFGFPDVMIGTLGLHDPVRYRVVPGFYRTNFAVTMNLNRWQALPKETRDLIEKIAIEYERTSVVYVGKQRIRDDEILRESGVKDIVLSGESEKKFLSMAHEALWQELRKRSASSDRLRARLYVP